MGKMAERAEKVLGVFESSLGADRARVANSTQERGFARACLADNLRFTAVARVVLKGDAAGFAPLLREAAELRLQTVRDYVAGSAPEDRSFCSPRLYQACLDALAAGAFDVAERIASFLPSCPRDGGAAAQPFDRALADAVSAVVLEADEAKARIAALRKACEARGRAGFAPYPDLLEAIVDRSGARIQPALVAVLDGHRRLCRGNAYFSNTEDELLAVWPLGLANLARHRGLPAQAIPPLIPAELLVPMG